MSSDPYPFLSYVALVVVEFSPSIFYSLPLLKLMQCKWELRDENFEETLFLLSQLKGYRYNYSIINIGIAIIFGSQTFDS